MELTPVNLSRSRSSGRGQQICEGSPVTVLSSEIFAVQRAIYSCTRFNSSAATAAGLGVC
jgi:hypothetical protein